MKKVLSVLAVSALVLTASVALAGGPGKKAAGCPEACQGQIDDLNSSQAQQNETLGAHSKQLANHEGRIADLEKAQNDPWYGRVGVRAAWMTQDIGVFHDVDSDAGFGGAVAFGREFTEWKSLGKFRAEVELAYQGADLSTDSYDLNPAIVAAAQKNRVNLTDPSYTLMTVMANGYYDIPVADAFSIYVMAGLGFAQYQLDYNANYTLGGVSYYRESLGQSQNALAYKAGVGVSYLFTEQIAGDLGFEYLGVADTGEISSINGYSAVASVRFKF